ncbi:hypothetical protein FISHEDRAFT_71978 [Fistulina hepatica ATCC 64428]|uniref:Uncharacterized protein n=1 Tax=Fistulina hepatica ATCC 64428 TaxID=1128425 RepID=A0A0D7AJ76_9AGAR|nr:hypothetical protein FISHEDRAFT_71978 [Fistulina hepatica ATCC 64428]
MSTYLDKAITSGPGLHPSLSAIAMIGLTSPSNKYFSGMQPRLEHPFLPCICKPALLPLSAFCVPVSLFIFSVHYLARVEPTPIVALPVVAPMPRLGDSPGQAPPSQLSPFPVSPVLRPRPLSVNQHRRTLRPSPLSGPSLSIPTSVDELVGDKPPPSSRISSSPHLSVRIIRPHLQRPRTSTCVTSLSPVSPTSPTSSLSPSHSTRHPPDSPVVPYLTPPGRVALYSRGSRSATSLPEQMEHHDTSAGRVSLPSPPPSPGFVPPPNFPRAYSPLEREERDNWLISNTYDTTPKFTRLGLASSNVVLPLSAKVHRRQSRLSALDNSNSHQCRHSHHLPPSFVDALASMPSVLKGRGVAHDAVSEATTSQTPSLMRSRSNSSSESSDILPPLASDRQDVFPFIQSSANSVNSDTSDSRLDVPDPAGNKPASDKVDGFSLGGISWPTKGMRKRSISIRPKPETPTPPKRGHRRRKGLSALNFMTSTSDVVPDIEHLHKNRDVAPVAEVTLPAQTGDQDFTPSSRHSNGKGSIDSTVRRVWRALSLKSRRHDP